MPKKLGLTSIVILASVLIACQTVEAPPADFHPETLRRAAIERTNICVLGYPVGQRDVRLLLIQQPGADRPNKFAQVEVTLKVLHLFIGQALTDQMRYEFYDERYATIIFGPPRGPAGHIGMRGVGIFCLFRPYSGVVRSVVDYYRPDIPTPWIREIPDVPNCPNPPDCIAQFLLTFHPHDDPDTFSAYVSGNALLAIQLTGFLNAFELLKNLAKTSTREVRTAACLFLSEAYALEFPASCEVTPQAEGERRPRAALLRGDLARGGFDWVHHRIGTSDTYETARYLEIVAGSPDRETRDLANALLRRAKGPNGKP